MTYQQKSLIFSNAVNYFFFNRFLLTWGLCFSCTFVFYGCEPQYFNPIEELESNSPKGSLCVYGILFYLCPSVQKLSLTSFPIFELLLWSIYTLHLEACNVSSAFHIMLQILANLCHPDGLWRNYNFRFTHLLQLGTSDHCQMGDVFINLRALLLCVVIFEYLNQKRKVIRRMHGYYLEHFLYTDCKVEDLAGEM